MFGSGEKNRRWQRLPKREDPLSSASVRDPPGVFFRAKLALLNPPEAKGGNACGIPANQLRLVVYPIICRVFIHRRWCRISAIKSSF